MGSLGQIGDDMKIIHGDLLALALAGRFDVIVHGCNCFHTMGAGIAAQIARAFPEAPRADRETGPGDRSKLGTMTSAFVKRDNARFVVVNAYTQFEPGKNADYDAIKSAFEDVARVFGPNRHVDPKYRIGYPMIGAGIAGGDWQRIAPIIDNALAGMDHTLVIYQP